MGQAALKSRSHRRYYLNKVLSLSLLFRGAFFSSRAFTLPARRYRYVVPFSLKDAIYIIRDFDEEVGLQVLIDHIFH